MYNVVRDDQINGSKKRTLRFVRARLVFLSAHPSTLQRGTCVAHTSRSNSCLFCPKYLSKIHFKCLNFYYFFVFVFRNRFKCFPPVRLPSLIKYMCSVKQPPLHCWFAVLPCAGIDKRVAYTLSTVNKKKRNKTVAAPLCPLVRPNASFVPPRFFCM